MYKQHLLTLNILNNNVTNLSTNVTQNDSNTNEITVMLTGQNNKNFDISEATKVEVSIIKANGNLARISEGDNLVLTDKANGILKIILTEESVTVCGVCQATIDVYKNTDRLTSSRFSYNVVSDINNDYTGSQVEETTLSQLITETEAAAAAANAATTAANAAANTATTAVANIPTTVTNSILNNTFSSLATTAKKIIEAINELFNGKLNKTDVVNTTTQVVADGKALNAVQANPNVSGTLAQQLNVLSGDSATLSITDFTQIDNLKATGPYSFIVTTGFIKDGISFSTGFLYTVKVEKIVYNGSFGVTQTITCNYSNIVEKSIYYRTYYEVGGWMPLQQITTTTKTAFSCTTNTGVTISQQDCYILNGEFIATLTVSITDGTSFSQNIVATLPFTPKSIYVGNAMGRTDLTTSAWLKKVNCYCDTSKNIAVTTEETTIKQILLTIKGGVT